MMLISVTPIISKASFLSILWVAVPIAISVEVTKIFLNHCRTN